jgi:hypothetical protein
MTSHQPVSPDTIGDPVVIPNVVVDTLFVAMLGSLTIGLLALLYNKLESR